MHLTCNEVTLAYHKYGQLQAFFSILIVADQAGTVLAFLEALATLGTEASEQGRFAPNALRSASLRSVWRQGLSVP